MAEEAGKKLTKTLLKNSQNPTLAWQIFTRIASSNPQASIISSIPLITRILVGAKMFTQTHFLTNLLINNQSSFSSSSYTHLLTLIRIIANAGHLDQAIPHFRALRNHFRDKPPSISYYNMLIKASLSQNNADFVSWLYQDLILSGVSPQTYTFNFFIGGLCDLGRLEDARNLFDKMSEKGCVPNEFTFGLLIRGYCRNGLVEKGVELLDVMENLGVVANVVIFNTLVSRFCKDGKTDEAEKLVERMRLVGIDPNVVTFNSRISALCSAGKILEASRIFRDMQIDKELGLPQPNNVTYNLMLQGFYSQGMLQEASTLVDTMKRNGIFTQLESYNIWLLGLVRNGKLLQTQSVLNEMVGKCIGPNIVSYNIVIDGLCKNGMLADARTVMGLMKSSGVPPDTVTYSSLLHGYCKKERVGEATKILHEMFKSGCLPNTYTCNILLHSLWEQGKISEAEKLLQKMNERGYNVDIVTCNIVIEGLCKSGKVDKAIEIVDGMWTNGSAALGELGNLYIGLVDDGYNTNAIKCMPDLVTYSILINTLCKDGRLDEAKKKFIEMIKKKLCPDSLLYNIFIHSFCKIGKLSSAFRVLKDMEEKGCGKNLVTYNSLIRGLGRKGQIFEMYGLMDEMKERGVSPNVDTYNNLISCLCDNERAEDAINLLDEMLLKGLSPNISSFKYLISAFCKIGEFVPAREVFSISLSICGHEEILYSLLFNGLLARGVVLEARELFEAAVDRSLEIENFLYKDLIERLCKDEFVDLASDILQKMMYKGYTFDHASFLPVIDGLSKRGKKEDADELAEQMLEMASEGKVVNKDCGDSRVYEKSKKYRGSDWKTIVHRDDGSGTALRTLRRVQKGWGQGSISSFQPPKSDYLDDWDGNFPVH
ncbi:pentatricopeptide repeat-containing protein At2g17140 [Apium graveolens]|uniref:pentatricopeptide repeat-containing protein At2g17140 n=1 Tax=Apium graveolens TaxID=4045 RepID=UPI003D7ACA51